MNTKPETHDAPPPQHTTAAPQPIPVAQVSRAPNGTYALFWRDGKNITHFEGRTLYAIGET